MSRVATVMRNSLWSALDLLVDVVMPPVISIVVARRMGPEKLGAFSYVMWISSALMVLVGFGISNAARKYLPEFAGQKNPGLFRAVLRLSMGVQTGCALLFALCGLAWVYGELPQDEHGFASLAMISVFPGSVMAIATAANEAMEDLRPNVVCSVIGGLTFALGVATTLVFDFGLIGLAGAQLASKTIDCSLRWVITYARLPGYYKTMEQSDGAAQPVIMPADLRQRILVFSWQATVLTVLTLVVWNRSEMYFLKRYSDIREVAFYSVAFSLGLVATQLVGPFSRAAGATLLAEQGRSNDAGVYMAQVYWRYLALLVLPATLGLAALSTPLVHVLYGEAYRAAAPVLLVAAAFGMFAPLAGPASTLAVASGGQGLLVRCGLAATVVTLSLDYVLVKSFDAVGGAWANGLGQLASTVAVWYVTGRHYGFRIPYAFAARLLAAAGGMGLVVGLFSFLVPDVVSIFVGPVLGATTYAVLLRLLRVVGEEDVERLLKIERMLPSRARAGFRRGVLALLPPTAPAA